ncbi:unnamed protein product [Larinioides sclopetarius]|uniref:CRAL-TRIO domain-containing protein n=1 Tax=Larinioides sclopetarius TaxID=280406 RepID=A0AAV2A3W3_9ARAC
MFCKWDPNELPFDYFKRIAVITFSQLFRDPMTQINGIKVIYDFDGTGLEQLKYGTPHNLYLFYYMAFSCIPGRYKEAHILNQNTVFNFLLSIIKRFLSEKMKNRVFVHSDIRQLLNYFPKSVLPEQYGGELLDMHATNFLQTANKEQKKNTLAGQPNFF